HSGSCRPSSSPPKRMRLRRRRSPSTDREAAAALRRWHVATLVCVDVDGRPTNPTTGSCAMHRLTWVLTLAFGMLCATAAHADERILSYHADIGIAADGSMEVAEHIRVRAEGNQINHGIYRDFPTTYRDPLRNRYRVAFDILGAERDGHREDWHTETRSNGVRIYLG